MRFLTRDHSGVRDLPSGTVTLLFTDVEGSTRLLDEFGDRYVDLLADHRRALRGAVERHSGVEVDTQGDAFLVAFARATDAVAAAEDVQRAMTASPVRLRIGIHTGEPLLTEEGYVGIDVHRGARIAGAGHGGQVVLSQTTRDLLNEDVEVKDLGEHRLKDLSAPQKLYQLGGADLPPLKTLHRANLPVQSTPLVGRERELALAADLLGRHRLVTLVGPGGSGKTRLALQLAAEAADEFENGAWWVSLAPLADPDLVEAAISQAVGAKHGLDDHLRSQNALLLLDNFEHLLAAAPRVAELLREAPRIKVLATSRAPLRLSGEQEYGVPPLVDDDAIALFSERARAVKPDFVPDEHVRTICHRLDGLPLALELAAARVRVLPPAKLDERLERALPLLSGGTRDAPERQRTLRATIEWSYELLTAEEKRLFVQLAVFAGTFSLEATEKVCDATIDVLQSLLEKSLIREAGPARFYVLETVHEFALERLESSAERDARRRRHLAFYLVLVEEAEPRLSQANVLAALGSEEANFRAALAYSSEHAPDLMLRLVASLWRVWFYRGRYDEARHWLAQALESDPGGSPLARANALRGLAAVHMTPSGDDDQPRILLEEAISLHREQRDDEGLARCLNTLGMVHLHGGNLDEATDVLEEALVIMKRLAEQGKQPGLAFPLGNLADVSLRRGDLIGSRRLSNEELDTAQADGDDLNVADAQGRLAWLAALEGDFDEAARLLRPPLRFLSEIGSQWPGGALTLAAVIAAHRDRRADAARLFGALDTHRARRGWTLWWWSESRVGRVTVETQQRLEADGFAWAYAEGQNLSMEATLELALGVIEDPRPSHVEASTTSS
jgi:predicted ATPase/class 3 adenylate cyclase